ncbi:glutamate--cysteine ligase [Acetobacter ghanensis]|uniref:Glutamate--cysteine ligase n=1 Tax=Acetobacter ghanensis TaxID=431306 RepID=A0A0U5BLM8_9PROT|nr:glutamate--cysteine ligase [Acetobacter ghanensis]NHO39174.1 glutamate--cysteine ligase [Acetobacter ghanensis]GBQ45192.1 glutamate--cysteine ligase [Acetobacter ghanensis DSM 18895]CEF56694.1 glutamate-cysteine ligase [Acetobacter ghanensis]
MSNPGASDETPVRSISQLAELLAQGCKPRDAWRIGTEHEKFGFVRPEATVGENAPQADHAAYASPPYAPQGIESLLRNLHKSEPDDWTSVLDNGHIIGLKGQGEAAGAAISLEPAGQFELSGAPLRTLHETAEELARHFDAVRPLARKLGLGFSPLGFHPTATRAQQPWMPKTRYGIMRDYMPKVGTLGLDMMQRTCTVQVNLDFGSEQDMVRKMQVSMALQPVATALFANSPFVEGKPNNFLSNRARVWTDTDNARSGMPACVFEKDFSFERYVEWALDVPMYFIMRDGKMRNVAGRSFRAWMQGDRQDGLEDVTPTLGDFEDHLTTAFPDVRLKQFIEMRGADAGSPEMMMALPALWTGLLYDDAALEAAWELVRTHPWEDYIKLRELVPMMGLDTPWGEGTVRDLAAHMLSIAMDGLQNRDMVDEHSQTSEWVYLAPLTALAAGAPTQAEHWLERYYGPWMGDASRIFLESEI